MNSLGLLQSKWVQKGFALTLHDTKSIHDSMNISKWNILLAYWTKWKRYTTIFCILWESKGQKKNTKALECSDDIQQTIRRNSTYLFLVMSELCSIVF